MLVTVCSIHTFFLAKRKLLLFTDWLSFSAYFVTVFTIFITFLQLKHIASFSSFLALNQILSAILSAYCLLNLLISPGSTFVSS